MKKIELKLSKRTAEKVEQLAKGGKIYTAYSGYSGGWKSAGDNTAVYTAILDKIGIKYKIDNDAARGGLNGKHIICKKFDAEKAKEYLKIKFFEDEIRAAEQRLKNQMHSLFTGIMQKVSYTHVGDFDNLSKKSTSGNFWFPHCPSPTESGIFYKNRQLVEVKFVNGNRIEEKI